jgi:hypothetical protein
MIVFGYIENIGEPNYGWINDHNNKIISELPEFNGIGITRSMFSVLPMNSSRELPLEQLYPQHGVQLITFAASYKRGYSLTPEWVDEFEDLLARLYWWMANVFVEAVGMRYQYEWTIPGMIGVKPPPPKQEWERTAYQLWHRVEISWNEAFE